MVIFCQPLFKIYYPNLTVIILSYFYNMIRLIALISIIFCTVITFAQNILISDQNFPNEPSIMMDPKHPEVLIAGANINKYYVSLDTGRTWTTNYLQSSYGVWGDPVIIVDTNGYFYFFHLSNPPTGNWIDRIVCQSTKNRGATWSDGSYTGLNGDKEQDKEWSIVDRKTNAIYVTWTQFDEYGSFAPEDSSIILFSKSLDEGMTWSDPLRISHVAGDCIDSDNTVEGAVPAVGPNGEIYVAWAGPEGIVFNKSLDQGETWLDREMQVDPMPTGWDYSIPGIYRANGLPITVCDLSSGEHHGTIYINWSDQRNGSDDTDVWLSKSINGGQTWSAPVRVNDDPAGKHQFFTWMTIDQTNGYLYFVFYDRRNYNDSNTDVYVALSTDGGNTFINRKISESPFVPNANVFFGDYTNITAHDGIVRPIWIRLHNGDLSVWTDLTSEEMLTSSEDVKIDKSTFESYPNPSNDNVYVSFKLHTMSDIELSLIDSKGNVLRKIIDHEKRGYGSYVEKIDPKKLKLVPGIYFLQLKVDDQVKTIRQLIVE